MTTTDRLPAIYTAPGGPEWVQLTPTRYTAAGTLTQLQMAIGELRRLRRYQTATNPVPDGRPGIYTTTITLTPTVQRTRPAVPRRNWRRTTAIAAAIALPILALLAWAVVTLVTALVAAITAHIGLIIAVIVVVSLLGGGGCTTIVIIKHRH